jgi:hypothetical protein
MHAAIAEIILENERNDYRFENFTREICEKHEGNRLRADVPELGPWAGRPFNWGGKGLPSKSDLCDA